MARPEDFPYFPGATQDIIDGYSRLLSIRRRWRKALTRPDIPENVLEHTEGLLKMDDWIVKNFPALAKGFDWDSSRGIKAMHCVHDGGEIRSKDLSFSDPLYDQLKPSQMDKESQGFQNLLDRYVTDSHLYQTAWTAFARYQDLDLQDKDAVFARLINMVSGIRFGLEHVYANGFTAGELDIQHAERSVEGLFKYGAPMLSILAGEEKTEMVAFLDGEIEGYRNVGFAYLADHALGQLHQESI